MPTDEETQKLIEETRARRKAVHAKGQAKQRGEPGEQQTGEPQGYMQEPPPEQTQGQ